jgi:putative acetyltransferase
VIVRRQRDDDLPAVRRMLTAAFADHGQVADLATALLARPDRPDASWVADDDTGGDAADVVGHVQLSRGWVDAPRELVEVLVLSPLAVDPRRQRHGIGRALLDAALAAADAATSPLVFLEGDPGFYGRLGWERASERGFTPPSVRIPDAAFQVVVGPAWRPWMTGALAYNDTFWAHDCVGLRPGLTQAT